jgi:hypothetical protein
MSAASQLFDWPTAKAALDDGWRVRRDSWTDDRWLERWTGGLIWLILNDGSKRVVLNTDFGADEFNALDWTNLLPECVTDGTSAGTGTNGCPLPYSPVPVTPTPTPTTPSVPVDPSAPPSGGSGAGQTGSGGGGGGGGGGGSGSNTPRRNPPNTSWPTLSVTAYDEKNDCYSRTQEDGDFVHPTFVVSVSMSSPANYSGPSFFFVTVKNASTVVGTGTLAPGGEQSFEWNDPNDAAPGTTLTFSARAWADGAPDLQGSGSGPLKPWCDTPCQPPYCCPGEDGHKCGDGCCCCPAYYAPNGPNCECIYVG